jgi:prevent-host-death family protein
VRKVEGAVLGKSMKRMSASRFKARCLKVIEAVQASGESVVITEQGTPVVQIVPIASINSNVFGFMAGEFRVTGDIESPVWSALGRARLTIPENS